jgi:ribosome biogenesis GTPase / thiamine phosphate phosphatase
MANKRKLTDQQKIRQSSYSSDQQGNWGLVLTHFGKIVKVVDKDNQIHECNIRQHVGSLVVGDEVLWRDENSNLVVVNCLERKHLLKRPDRYKGEKLIAANIDQALVVIPCDPEPDLYTLDRYLIALNYYDIKAIILFHKNDLAASSFEIAGEEIFLDEVFNYYKDLNYDCYKTETVSNISNLNNLKNILNNNKSILVGLSGAGKSSLLNALNNSQENLAIVGELSEHNKKGKHTTSRTTLYPVNNNIKDGCLIDSPGIRRFGLWNLSDDEVLSGFLELSRASRDCKFRNCNHDDSASGCAIKKFISDLDPNSGANFKLARLRLRHYFRILSES